MFRSFLVGLASAVAAGLVVAAGTLAQAAGGPPTPEAPSASDAPASPAVRLCCGQRCIAYRYHGRAKCCGDCKPPVKTVLLVKDPGACTCCYVQVPVCLPACCTGSPQVHCRKGIFKDGVVTYSYCCGVRVKVVFDRCGDIVVHYYGV